jgi:hypothetical protein
MSIFDKLVAAGVSVNVFPDADPTKATAVLNGTDPTDGAERAATADGKDATDAATLAAADAIKQGWLKAEAIA